MNSIVEEILSLEKEYGHTELYCGAADESEVLDKLGLLCSMMKYVGDDNDPDTIEQAMEPIIKLITAHALSPECAAYILFLQYPDDDYKYAHFERLYKDRSGEDRLIFRAVFYKFKYDEAYNELHLFDRYIPINKQYITRYGSDKAEAFTGKGAVYTVITGGYDNVCDPVFIDPGFDYYCFTDDPDSLSSNVWNIRKLEHIVENDTVRTQRYAKMHPHLLLPEYDYTIYIDGNFTIKGDLKEYINLFSRGKSMLLFPHSSRSTLAEEVRAIKELRLRIDPNIRNEYDEQIEQYMSEGYNDDEPLVENGCMVRSNRDEKLNAVMEDWWNELSTKTARDQLSIGYVCWKNHYKYDISALSIYYNDYIEYNSHMKDCFRVK